MERIDYKLNRQKKEQNRKAIEASMKNGAIPLPGAPAPSDITPQLLQALANAGYKVSKGGKTPKQVAAATGGKGGTGNNTPRTPGGGLELC